MPQVDAGHAQRAAGGRQQAAEHAKGRRLAGAVGAEQAEDLAALHLEADVIDRGEVAELAHQVAAPRPTDRPRPWPARGSTGRAGAAAVAVGARAASQQHHEPVLEARRDGAHRRRPALPMPAARRRRHGGRNAPRPPAARRRRRWRVVEQPRLQRARRLARPAAWRRSTGRRHAGAIRSGVPDASTWPWCSTNDLRAALGLVEVRGADQHRQALSSTSCCDDLPQLAPRQRIDADRRLVEQQQLGRAHQRAGQAELLLHAAGELARRPRGERPEVGHLHQPWRSARARSLAGTPWRSA